ncbi:IclR family transcriptional regulator [Pullulanibacillus camelliae]|uniref:IclR family transcriptional regulator n=1 Tax=Pullulanibacillus camelliae TaxID=1707096 RepID=A0A8J2VLF1_9BACL|nr:IclR family transcriptional regulator [Pullulanibacillus camelliae]GGE27376.1 IclR family transcriptional regulator [Pullulanibacillus camelliae]
MGSKTLLKSLSLLDKFTLDTPTWGLRELARELDMSHTIVYRLLSTFEEKGYIYRDPDTHKYHLGIKFMELGNIVEDNLRLLEVIQPIMKNIAIETGESVVLTILDNLEGIFVKIVESDKHVRFAESVGRRSPLYIGASHKTILAYLPKDTQQKVISQGIAMQVKQIKSEALFIQQLESIQEKGWAYSVGETFEDVSAVAVPLFDGRGTIVGSLSVAGPVYRLSSEAAQQQLVILQHYQKEMNAILSNALLPTRREAFIGNLL